MALVDNLSKFTASILENPNLDIEEIQELIIDTPDSDIRASLKPFSNMCHVLTEALVQTRRSVCGINLMLNAISKIQAHENQLTPIHSDLCMLCLDSKCLNPALKYLELEYINIKKIDDKEEDTKNVLAYYYYGGLIYTALKNFDRASYFFEVVLTMPASVMTPIMQEAYKKQMILNLLIHGRLQEDMLPKYASPCVSRRRESSSMLYFDFAREYSTMDYHKAQHFLLTKAKLFDNDENFGLIAQCCNQVRKRSIQRLTKTFLTLPLSTVKEDAGLSSDKEAELFILNMVDDGEIFATINQKDQMVVFNDNPEKYDSTTMFQKLQDDLTKSIDLINMLKRLEAETSAEARALAKFSEFIEGRPLT